MENSPDNPIPYNLKPCENFTPTADLKLALSSFLGSCKGIHLALICQDIPLDKDELFNLLDKKYNKININIILENAWREGLHSHCTTLKNIQEAFDEVINCIKALGKDVASAQTNLNMLNNDININRTHNLPQSNAWTHTRAISISNSLLQQDELSQNCADIKILICLPLDCFNLFEEKDCHFPSFLKCVLKGITPEQKTEEELIAIKKRVSKLEDLIYEVIETIRTSYTAEQLEINQLQAMHIALDIVYEFKENDGFENFFELSSPQKYKEFLIFLKQKLEKEVSD